MDKNRLTDEEAALVRKMLAAYTEQKSTETKQKGKRHGELTMPEVRVKRP